MAVGTEQLRVNVNVDGDRDLSRLAAQFAKLGTAAQAAGKATATVAGVGALSGPAITGLLGAAKATAAFGKALASLPPLAATLPSLAAGFALVAGTAKLAGPAMGKALMPVADAFRNIQGRIGVIASKQLPGLAREFVKVNFPSIRRAMEEIAADLNTVVVMTGRWINSASGQETIRKLTEATAEATEKLDGRIARVAIAFGEMTQRIGGRAIAGAADAMARLAEKTIDWLDSIDNADIDKAIANLSMWGGKVKDTFVALRDVGRWMVENEEKVKRFSDVLAGTAIVLGVATGNWVAVLAGSFSLAVNHWDELKAAFSDSGPIKTTFASLANDPHLRGWAKSVREAFDGFRDSFNKATEEIGPKWARLVQQLKIAWDEWGPVIQAWWDGVGKPVFSALGRALGFFLEHVITSMTVSAYWLGRLGDAFKLLWQVASAHLGFIINGLAKVLAFTEFGPALKKAADDFNAFAARVNKALDGIEDEVVTITYRQVGRAVPISSVFQSGIGGRAHGGPIWQGQTYLTGEQGPELITAGANGMVHNAADTRRMLSGGQVLRAELVTGGGGTSAVAGLIEALVDSGVLRLRVVGDRVVAA